MREGPEGLIVESTHFQGPNVVICKVVYRVHLTPLIGAYLPPPFLDQLQNLDKEMNRFLDRYVVVLGDMNTYISHLRSPWDQQVADFLASFGLADLLGHF